LGLATLHDMPHPSIPHLSWMAATAFKVADGPQFCATITGAPTGSHL
jgi:hypothetical protein